MTALANSRARKSVYILVSIGLIITILSGVFILLFQENHFSDIKITDFSVDDEMGVVGGLVVDWRFNLTVENKGVDDVSGLMLDVKVFSNGTELQVGNFFTGTFENCTLKDPLEAGEVREVTGNIMVTVGDNAMGAMMGKKAEIVSYVILDNVVLDQRENVWN